VGRYLDIADAIPRADPKPDGWNALADDPTKPDSGTGNARRLRESAWKPKVSFGKRVIWERPDTGFYYSEESALHLLDVKNIRDKSGANTRR